MPDEHETNSGFRPAEEVVERATAILERERRRLEQVAPDAHLVLTGASSLPGALTSGDIDLHLRAPAGTFAATVETLERVYDIVNPEIWCDTLATFVVPGEPTTGIAVTPIDSLHDRRFVLSWNRLRTQPEALAAYNAIKQSFSGPGEPAYRAAKSAFFDALETAAEQGRPVNGQ